MSAHSRDDDRAGLPGTSRRDVLRGGAVGLGAFVGASALINANGVSAEARATTSIAMVVGFAGINLSHPVPLHSFSVGGDNINGSLNEVSATLTLTSSKYSPLLLKAYVDGTNLSKIVIDQSQADRSGIAHRTTTITLGSARIFSFHTDVSTPSPAHVRDVLQVSFGALTIARHDSNTTYTWALPT
jgi:type VI protein secretion system component Hcp